MAKEKTQGFFPEDLAPGYEFSLGGREYLVDRVFGGSNNSYVLRSEGSVIKLYGEKANVPMDEVGQFIAHIYMFHLRLAEVGVCVPPVEQLVVRVARNPRTGKLMVIHETPFMGESLEDRLIEAKTAQKAILIIRSILGCLEPLLRLNPKMDMRSVGVDSAIRNFVSENGGAAVYTDDVPPKLKIGGTYLLEKPEVTDPATRKIGIYRHYSVAGLMNVLLVHASRLLPEYYPDFQRELARWLRRRHLYVSLRKFEQRLGGKKFKGTADDIPLIKSLGFSRIYVLRELACYYASLGLLSQTELDQFFTTSHFQNLPLPLRTIQALRRQLIEAVS